MADECYKRKLTALLSADVAGYSRLMREDEEATVRTLTAYRNVLTHLIHQYRGRVVDSPGDNILAEFGSVVDAVNCAVEIQRDLAERNAELPENRRMQFRIGLNLGDVIEDGERIYGDGVNIAARMESMAEVRGSVFPVRCMTRSKARSAWNTIFLASRRSKTSTSRCGPTVFCLSRAQQPTG